MQGVGVERPFGDGDAVGLHRRALQARRRHAVGLGEDLAADQPARLAHVHFPRETAVVGELVLGQAPLARFGADAGRHHRVVLQEPEQAEREVAVARRDLVARGPVAGGIGAIAADQQRGVPACLGVRDAVGEAPARLQFQIDVAFVARRFRHGQAVRGIAGPADAEVVRLDGVIGLARAAGQDFVGFQRKEADVEAEFGEELRVRDRPHLREDLPGVRFAVLRAAFAADDHRRARLLRQVALVAGVDERRSGQGFLGAVPSIRRKVTLPIRRPSRTTETGYHSRRTVMFGSAASRSSNIRSATCGSYFRYSALPFWYCG